MTAACRRRWGAWMMAAGLALAGVRSAQAAPTVEQMLTFRPKQEGVVCTTPAADNLAACKVELVKGASGRGSGWVLKDDNGKYLRKFFDTNGDNRIDVWSYYKDGVEVYSEIDTTFSGKPDQYRWLNSGGMKWGIDDNKDGKIDSWKAISPEEVSQELLAALAKNDVARFQALLLSEAEIKALPLSAEDGNRLREQVKNATDRFQDAITKLGSKLGPKTAWLHLETGAPQCVPNEGGDLIRHARGTVLFDIGGGSDWLQTGELYQVGANSWRLAGGPTPGAAPPEDKGPGGIADPEVAKLIEKLGTVKEPQGEAPNSPAMVKYHLARADLIQDIVAKVKDNEREPWVRQVADSLSAAAQASAKDDTSALERLRSLEANLVKLMPAHNLTAYVTFREMQADYSLRLQNRGERSIEKVQTEWLERLAKFVQSFPKADDTPDAMLQAGMVAEFLNKEVDAKNWYGNLAKNFAEKPQAIKAKGAVERLNLEGNVLKLAAPTLSETGGSFDVESLKGKVVVVYYWASWNTQTTGDFDRLKTLSDKYSAKGLELVCVNLDQSAEEAKKFLKTAPVPATHLYQSGGLEGKLATDYGIMVLPQMFLIGKDGKVSNRNAQIANVEDEIKKLVK